MQRTRKPRNIFASMCNLGGWQQQAGPFSFADSIAAQRRPCCKHGSITFCPRRFCDFASGIFLGGRYFFSSQLGGFAELGYDQTFLKIGLAARF